MKVLRDYQKLALRYTFRVRHPALFLQMRLGKTLICIRRIKSYKNCNSVLIVGPYACFKSWVDELKEEGEGKPIILDGPAQKRIDKLFYNWALNKWFLLSKEGDKVIPEIVNYPWDVIVLDESFFIKEPSSKVTKFYLKHFKNVAHRWILCGEPAPYSYLNYYCQLKFLLREIIPWKNYWYFRNSGFNLVGFDYHIKKKTKEKLKEILAQYCYFLTRKQAGIKEDRIYIPRLLKAPSSVHKQLRKLELEFVYDAVDEVKSTKWATVRFQWMRDICSNLENWNGKAREIKYLLDTELKDQPVVIYATRVNQIDQLCKFLRKYSPVKMYGATPKKRMNEIEDEFRAGKYQVLICNPEVVKYGRKFDRANTVIHYSSAPMETRMQAEDRIVLPNKTEPYLYIDLITQGTIEEILYNDIKLREKENLQFRKAVLQLSKKYDKKVSYKKKAA